MVCYFTFILVKRQETLPPTITLTEDTNPHADEADFVKYFGLEAYAEGSNVLHATQPELMCNMNLN